MMFLELFSRPGFDAPVGQLVVAFDYFEHSQGDFCTVDSYLHEAGVTLMKFHRLTRSTWYRIT